MKSIILICFLSLSYIFGQSNYFVSSSLGNDSNEGKSESKPFKSISKINSIKFFPGDNIFFKANDIWIGEKLIIQNSGNQSDKITYSSYGNGSKPIITTKSELPGWRNQNNWTQSKNSSSSPNVWEIKLDIDRPIDRCWVNDSEIKLASHIELKSWKYNESNILFAGDNGDGTKGVCESHKFYFNNEENKFYIYSILNPATNYKSIELPGTISNGAGELETVLVEADFIYINNLDIQGSFYASVGLAGADYVTFENCNIGKNSNWAGIVGDRRIISDMTSSYITIKNCNIDSDWDYDYIFYTQRTPWGIAVGDGTDHWIIDNCLIKDWWMCINLSGRMANSQYHTVSNNDISSNCSFGKAIQMSAGGNWETDENTYNKVYNNYIHDIIFGIQVSSSNNYFYFNVFKDLKLDSWNEHGIGDGGFAFHIIEDWQNASPDHNYVFNNTFYNLRNYAFTYTARYAYLFNNLFINTGTVRNTNIKTDNWADAEFRNNLFYRDNSSANSDLVTMSDFGNLSISEFNALNGKYDKTVIGNIHFIGPITDLINSDLSLPNKSKAKEAGIDISNLVDNLNKPILTNSFRDMFGNTIKLVNPNIGAYGGNGKSGNIEESDIINSNSNNSKIQIIFPNGNEIFKPQTIQQIKWQSNGVNVVHIFFSSDNGENWTQLGEFNNEGYYNWEIPSIISNNCIVRVKDANNFAIFDKSDSPFSIYKSDTISNTYLKVFLEAPFKDFVMNNILFKKHLLPQTQPYGIQPWNYSSNSKLSLFKDNYTDWILVELRSDINSKLYAKEAILDRDGNVLNINGNHFTFENINNGEYYIAIRHRNHISVISSSKIQIRNNEPILYNFTDSQSKAYGKNPMVEIGNNIFALYAGDADGNGIINNLDFGIVANNILKTGYNSGDIDMNGIINILDYSIINNNILKSSYIR